MKIRELREDEVEFTIEAEQDDIPVRGSFASGDDEKDEELAKEILARLDRGDVWAWASVKVTAMWKDWKGVDYLGACSYESEADFKQDDGYYGDMKARALEDLNKSLAKCAADLAELMEQGVNVQPLINQLNKELAKS
jgi:hypothetical protein